MPETLPAGEPAPPVPPTEAAPPAAAERPSLPGYEIHEELGRGGMGVVYKARQLSLNRFVALKMILAGPYAGPEQLARFRVEAESVARLQHPGIVQIHEIGSHAGHSYLALEYVSGGTLARRCAGKPLPPAEAARMVEALARAVHYAHQQGVIHRDLKPANVLLQTTEHTEHTEKGQEETLSSSVSSVCSVVSCVPKIADFGLAKMLDAGPGPQTLSGAILGTPAYMAPEQAGGKRGTVGPPVDIYALGAILYELLTGRPPFRADNPVDVILKVTTEEPAPPRQVEPGVPRDLEAVCLKCLRKDPATRYASAQALANDLARFLSGEPTAARPLTRGARVRRWAWRRRWWLAGCGTVASLLLLLTCSLAINALAVMFGGIGGHVTSSGGDMTLSGAPEVVATSQPRGGQQVFSTAPQVKTIPAPRVSPGSIDGYVRASTAWLVAEQADSTATGTGTGALIDRKNRLLLTSYHAIHGLQEVVVLFPRYDKDRHLILERKVYLAQAKADDAIKGKVIGHDRVRDLALIQLNRLPDGIDALPVAKTPPHAGEALYAIGNPGAGENLWAYTSGRVRGVGQKRWNAQGPGIVLHLKANVVEADSPTDPGDSGGPCCNGKGELVGVTQGVVGGVNAVSYSICCTEVQDFLNRAFMRVPELQGKSWERSKRPPP